MDGQVAKQDLERYVRKYMPGAYEQDRGGFSISRVETRLKETMKIYDAVVADSAKGIAKKDDLEVYRGELLKALAMSMLHTTPGNHVKDVVKHTVSRKWRKKVQGDLDRIIEMYSART